MTFAKFASSALLIAAVVLGVVGCSTGSVANHLSSPRPQGSVALFFRHSGSGSQRVGTFSASGKVSISGSCIGKGSVTVTAPPTSEKFAIACVRPGGGWAGLGTVTFPLGSIEEFQVAVTAPSGTRWVLGGAASGS
jgi:hypothetical protein